MSIHRIVILLLETMRTHLTVSVSVLLQVVLADSELRDGFNLATRIIQLFQLPMEDILCHMARSLTLNERYQDIKNLLDLIQHKDSLFDQEKQDKVVMAAVKMGSQHSKDVSDASLYKVVTYAERPQEYSLPYI